MALLALQTGIIYGPVSSRRLGRSLGINLLPHRCKLCSFDCVYCHYGRTQLKALFPDSSHFPALGTVLQAIEEGMWQHPDIDYLTFSGNGEPTLHPDFAAIVSGVRDLRDRLRPAVRLAILSNSTTAHLPSVQEALRLLDEPIMKLDAGDARTLAALNHPADGVTLEQIVGGLRGIPGLIIQSVLVDGRTTNTRGEAFDAWLATLAQIKPARIQIYSTDRPVPDSGVERVSPAMLQQIAGEIARRCGLEADAYWVQRGGG